MDATSGIAPAVSMSAAIAPRSTAPPPQQQPQNTTPILGNMEPTSDGFTSTSNPIGIDNSGPDSPWLENGKLPSFGMMTVAAKAQMLQS